MFEQNQSNQLNQGAPTPPPKPDPTAGLQGPTPISIDALTSPIADGKADKVKETEPALAPENAEIYYMPDTFRKNNAVAGKQTNIPGVWVLIITVVLLLLLGGGLVLYWVQPSFLSGIFGGEAPAPVPIPEDLVTPSNTIQPLSTEETTTTQGAPKETYLAFQRELAGATTVEAFLEVYLKYGTQAKYDLLVAEKSRLEDAGLTTNMLDRLRALGSPILDGTEDISQITSETEATLTIVKTNNRDSGTVTLVLENNVWKISEEQWTNTSIGGEEGGAIQSGTDSDNDGLTDKEEVVLGTNINAIDSDGDTYADLVEVSNGYNPAGEGKLSDNQQLGTYVNTTFNVSFLYPLAWQQKVASTDDSVILTAPDEQFIQVLVQPNTERQDILSWYKKTFDVETIPTSQLFTTSNWDSVRTPDGLTAYITNKDKSYIFIITYNLTNSRVLNYKQILDLMLRNFTFRV